MKLSTISGDGLLANAFRNYIPFDVNDVHIFASGVSNSKEIRQEEFNREMALVKDAVHANNKLRKKVVYFSSCSVIQRFDTKYINHKLNVEQYIQKNSYLYNIFRIPQVVGPVKNKTLLSFFVENISSGLPLDIDIDSTRYLIDVNDLVRIVHHLISLDGMSNSIMDISSSYPIKPIEIVLVLIRLFNINKYNLNFINRGEKTIIQIDELRGVLGKFDPIFDENYAVKVINENANLILQSIRGGKN